MPTDKQRAASRANGAASRGPKTPEGKARSSRNARTHGLSAAPAVAALGSQDLSVFQSFLDSLLPRLRPANSAEHHCVERMAYASWAIRRATGAQMLLLTPSAADPAATLAALGPLLRYEARWRRHYHLSFRTLRELQAARLNGSGAHREPEYASEKKSVQNEPGTHRIPLESTGSDASGTRQPEEAYVVAPCCTPEPALAQAIVQNEPGTPLIRVESAESEPSGTRQSAAPHQLPSGLPAPLSGRHPRTAARGHPEVPPTPPKVYRAAS